MSLIKWNPINKYDPFRDLTDLRKEISQLFDFPFTRLVKNEQALDETVWAPAVDAYESKESYVIKADLPGVTQKEIEISVDDGVLKIKGEKKKESAENKRGESLSFRKGLWQF